MNSMKWMQYAKSFFLSGCNVMPCMYFGGCEGMGDKVSNNPCESFLWWKGSMCLLISETHKGWF